MFIWLLLCHVEIGSAIWAYDSCCVMWRLVLPYVHMTPVVSCGDWFCHMGIISDFTTWPYEIINIVNIFTDSLYYYFQLFLS